MKRKIGIIICDRYSSCGGGKCFRAAAERSGAFSRYPTGTELEIVGYSTCGGCPGGNVEYVPEEMVKNGAEVIHLATGMLVGYPPCPRVEHFRRFIEERYGVQVVAGTHPIPEKYRRIHSALGTWKGAGWDELLDDTMADPETRMAYD